ncbi:hypothetical protein [Bacillus thuringiensis]|uniref:Uncharacterized protein n=1 Tax=Bacillus thuringiensis DB27 TaxID=1431339 RepID=W8YH39_BACTU|nr:hypothetical protein [Bacillus thuringiensis]MBG9630625.1 phage related protein [Bacillus thuringiensis]MBG9633646.1 phage related protein [Bacillus thuringiensis]MBG9665175.1 phage related protein [Bacillus thuringiensis]MBG9670225.1 phage related protein [Bacillus thuringiensis]MBH0351347.1 phage related protein [Bacillus thuringiensis]
MANNKLKINIDADTSEALKQMKEVTDAANECVAALEKLEKIMGRFTGKSEVDGFTVKVPTVLDGKTISEAVSRIQPMANTIVSRTC